jgi:hypothetical protein
LQRRFRGCEIGEVEIADGAPHGCRGSVARSAVTSPSRAGAGARACTRLGILFAKLTHGADPAGIGDRESLAVCGSDGDRRVFGHVIICGLGRLERPLVELDERVLFVALVLCPCDGA